MIISNRIPAPKNGSFDPAHPDEDVITTYGYDELGRQIWMRDALGHYDVTHYNAAGQVDWSARNFSALGWNGGTTQPSSLPAYTPAAPDLNVATLYGYDGLGRTVLVTQTGILTGTFNPSTLQFSDISTRVTKTEYDTLSRPVTTTLDYGGLNVQTLTYYDGASNPIWQRDALGRWTKTDYDALNRPITTTVNYEDGDPLTGARDADILTVTHYDAAGRTDQQIDNYVNGVFSATAPITDRVTLSAYDTFGRVISSTLNYAPGESGTDLNRVQQTAYDPVTMRTQGQRDPLGRWVSQQYDLLGRVTTTIQNCRTSGNVAVATGCDAFSGSYPDRNVPSETHYDALGRAFESVDALGHVTHTDYDSLGRAIATTQNYVFGGSVLTDTNVTTRMGYDVLGHTTVMTDALGHASSTSYNGLGQTTLMTDTLGRVTHMGYDGSGALRWTKHNDGQLTLYQLDGLGRTIATIVNRHFTYDTANQSATATDALGQTTSWEYDAGGRVTTQHDPRGNSYDLTYHYSGLDQITQTLSLNLPTPIDAQYDALGRRTSLTDGTGTTSFGYDGLSRIRSVQAPNTGHIGYDYDARGQRTQLIYPDGSVLHYGYLADGQLQVVTSTTTLASYSYDSAGRLQTVARANGATTTYSYDAADRLRDLHTSVSSTAVSRFQYSVDRLGQRTNATETLSTTRVITYAYDGLQRLVGADESPGTSYASAYAYAGTAPACG